MAKLTLPPFAGLRAFHAAATHERYRDAAESLGLTESAISHQVRRLEEFLQTALIDRSGRRSTLTEAGRRYLAQIEPAMQQIHTATEALLPASGRAIVRLTLPPSLAATWLIPRLGAFERAHDEIDLQLVTTTRVVDLRRDQVELGIRHGKGDWPDVAATFLLPETAMPVCAPGYLDLDGKPPTAASLRGVRFIATVNFPDDWEEWTVVDDWLARGRLVAPFGTADPTGAAYYLCRTADVAPTAAGRRVERWLIETAEEWISTHG